MCFGFWIVACQNAAMTTPEPLLLYTRSGCHLCEQVEAMLARLGIAWRELDIDGDPALAGKYGLTIPVLEDEQGRQLFYPFDEHRLRRFAGVS